MSHRSSPGSTGEGRAREGGRQSRPMGPKPTSKKTLSKMCCVSLCKLLFHITLEMQIVLLVVEIQNFPCTVLQENVCRKRGWGGMLWSEHQQLYWVYGEMWGNTNGIQRLIHAPQIWGLPTVPKAAVRSLPMLTHADLKVIRGDTTHSNESQQRGCNSSQVAEPGFEPRLSHPRMLG